MGTSLVSEPLKLLLGENTVTQRAAPSLSICRRFCKTDLPAQSLPAGSGALCFTDRESCNEGERREILFGSMPRADIVHSSPLTGLLERAGPNVCSPQSPCTIQFDLCSSGLVKPSSSNIWACRSDRPSGAVLNVRAVPWEPRVQRAPFQFASTVPSWGNRW